MLCFRSGIVARGRLVGSVSCVSCTILVVGGREGFCGVLTLGLGGCVVFLVFLVFGLSFWVSTLVRGLFARYVRLVWQSGPEDGLYCQI